MSKENIISFLQCVNQDEELARKVSLVQVEAATEILDKFIALAAEVGKPFTLEEYKEYMMEKS